MQGFGKLVMKPSVCDCGGTLKTQCTILICFVFIYFFSRELVYKTSLKITLVAPILVQIYGYEILINILDIIRLS